MLTRALIVTRGAAVGEMALAGLGPDGDECHKLLGIEKQRIERALDAAGWHRGKACDSQGYHAADPSTEDACVWSGESEIREDDRGLTA